MIQNTKVAQTKIVSKKLISFAGIGLVAFALLFLAGVSTSQAADSTLQGNLPNTFGDGVNIYAYNAAQDSGCDGVADGGEVFYGSTLWGTISGNLDTTYANTDTDYSLTVTQGSIVPGDLYVYFCDNSNNVIDIYNVADFDVSQTRNISLGKISNGTSSALDDLDNYYIAICTAADGTKYNDTAKQVDAAQNQYVQYYAFEQADDGIGSAPPSTITAMFDSTADNCTYANTTTTKRTGYLINVTSASDNFGIVIAYNPDTKVTGDAINAADLATAEFTIYDDAATAEDLTDDTSAGMGFEIKNGNPNGDGGDDDFTIYYDSAKVTSDIHVQIETASNGTTHWLSIDEADFDDVASAAGAYDILVDLNDAGGGVPSDIDDIQVTCNVNAGVAPDDSAIFKTLALHGTYFYDIYMPDCSATETVIFKKSSTSVYQKTSVNLTATAAIDVGKVSGTAHADILTGGNDLFEVYSDALCTTEVSAINAFGAAGVYEVYFEEEGSGAWYIKVTQDSGGTDYQSCGNQITLTNQAATQNLDRKVTAVVPTAKIGQDTIDTVMIDFNEGGTWTAATDVWSRDIESGTANLYTITGDSSVRIIVADDDDADPTNGLGVTVYYAAKDVDADDVTMNVAGVEGDVHGDLDDGTAAGDLVEIYSTEDCSTTQVSTATEGGTIAEDPDYGIFYEATEDAADYFALFQDNSVEVACMRFANATGGGAANTLSPKYKLTTTIPAANDATGDQINSIAVDNDKDDTWDVFGNNTDAAGTNITYSVLDADSNLYAYYDADAEGTVVLLKESGVVLSADETAAISVISGDIDPTYVSADTTGAVTDDADGLVAAYTDWDNNTTPTGLSNSHYVVTNSTDNYAIYLDTTAGSIANVDIKVKDSAGYVSWTMDQDDGGGAIAAGASVDIDLAIKVSGDTPVGTDHINIVDSGAANTHLAAGVIDTVSGLYAIYTLDHDPGVGEYIQGIAQEPKHATANTNAKLIRNLTAAGVKLADKTWNVAKFSGTNHASLDGGTVVVHSNTTCGAAVSSETANPAAGVWSQYFEGSDSSTYYIAISDGTHTTCKSSGDALSGNTQAVSGITFDKKISGTVPDKDDTNTDVLSVGVTGSGAASEFAWVNTVDPGAAVNTYSLFIDKAATGMNDATIKFYDAVSGDPGAGNVMLSRASKDYSDAADETSDVYSVYGNAHANLEDVIVCDAVSTSNADCATANKVGDEETGVGGGAYEAFFEKQAGTDYWLRVKDTDATYDYYSFNVFSTTTAVKQRNNVEIDGKLDGSVREAYDTGVKVPDVLVQMYDDAQTAEISRTYTYTGTSAPGGNYRLYGDLGVNIDSKYTKAGYITQWNEAGVLNQANVNIDLASGIKVTVDYEGGQKAENATVTIYVCTSATACPRTTIATCDSGDCQIAGDGSAGSGDNGEYYFSPTENLVQVKVEKSSFDTVWDPDQEAIVSGGAEAYNIDEANQRTPTVTLRNPAPSSITLISPANGLVTTDVTPDLSWVDLGGDETYYEVQVDDNDDFLSLHAGGGNTATGAITTWIVDSDLTNGVKYYWRVRGCDAGNCGDWSEARYFYVNTGWNTIGAPTVANTAGEDQVTISWATVTGAKSYSVYRDINPTVTTGDTKVDSGITQLGTIDTVADGDYYYAITAVDEAGNESTISTASAKVTVDTTPPTNLVISIAGGAEYTTAAAVNITVAATGAAQMQFSCDGTTWTVAESYGTTRAFNLTTEGGCGAGQGAKTVTVRMIDAVGNTATLSDGIILDSVAPDVSGANIQVAVSGGQVTVTWTAATDATSGIASYAVYRDGGAPVAASDTKVVSGLTAIGFTDGFSVDGTWYYAITATDKAGNTSAISPTSAAAIVDVTGPSPISVAIVDAANRPIAYSTNTTLRLLLTWGDAAKMQFSCNGGTNWSAQIDPASPYNLDLTTIAVGCTGDDGLKVINVKMIDAATPVNASYAFTYVYIDTDIDTDPADVTPAADVDFNDNVYTWTWTPAIDNGSGVSYYQIEVSDDGGLSWDAADGVWGNTYTLSGLARNEDGYKIRVRVIDVAGNAGAWVESGGLLIGDATAPTVLDQDPGDGDTDVSVWIPLALLFSEEMDPATVNNNTVQVRVYDTEEPYPFTSVYYNSDIDTAFIIPILPMDYETQYYFWAAGAKDLAGNVMTAYDTKDDQDFTTEAAPTGDLGIDQIILLKSWGNDDDNWPNAPDPGDGGWEWVIRATIPTDELDVDLKFDDWTGPDALPAADNIRYFCEQSDHADDTNAITITAADTYPSELDADDLMVIDDTQDLEDQDGIQVEIIVQAKIPAGTDSGSYSTSFGIRSK